MSRFIFLRKFGYVLSLALPLLLSGCPWDDAIRTAKDEAESIRADLNRQIDVTRKTMADAVDAGIIAVPGERWLRLIDDLNGTDPEKKRKAQAYLMSVAHIDLSAEYDATVWFDGLPPDEHLDVILFRAATPDFAELEVHETRSSLHERFTINGLETHQNSLDQVKQDIYQKALSFLNDLIGEGEVADFWDPRHQTGGIYIRHIHWQSRLRPDPFEWVSNNDQENRARWAHLTDSINGSKTAREAEAHLITDTFFKLYAAPISGVPPIHEIPWSLADDQQYLFILVKGEDLDRLKDSKTLKISAVVHKRGDASATVGTRDKLKIELREFTGRKDHPLYEVRFGNDKVAYAWVAVNMTDSQGYGPETAQRIQGLRDELKKWSQIKID